MSQYRKKVSLEPIKAKKVDLKSFLVGSSESEEEDEDEIKPKKLLKPSSKSLRTPSTSKASNRLKVLSSSTTSSESPSSSVQSDSESSAENDNQLFYIRTNHKLNNQKFLLIFVNINFKNLNFIFFFNLQTRNS